MDLMALLGLRSSKAEHLSRKQVGAGSIPAGGSIHPLDRRAFLRFLGATAAGVALAPTLDLDRLLWTPKPIIVVPSLNTLVTPDWITREIAKMFTNNLEFLKQTNRLYDDRFSVGGAVNVALPVRFAR